MIIVFRDLELQDRKPSKVAIVYIEGEEVPVKHVGGTYNTESGYLTTVVETLGRGAVLRLADDTMLSVPNNDQYAVRLAAPALQSPLGWENRLYLYNLKKGKRVSGRSG